MTAKKRKAAHGGSGVPFQSLALGKAEFLRRMKPLIDANDFERAATLARGQASRNPADYEAKRVLGLCLTYTSQFAEASAVIGGLFRSDPNRVAPDHNLFWALLCSLVRTDPAEAVRMVEARVAAGHIAPVQGYRWIRYIGQYIGDFKMIREVSERFLPSWSDVFSTLPALHREDGTVRFPAVQPTLPLYAGGKIDGETLVVYDGSGFGDCFFSVRWLPLLKRLSKAARLVFVVRPELKPLVEPFLTGIEVVGHTGREYVPEGPARFTALVFLTTIIAPGATELWPDPYISISDEIRETWRRRLESLCPSDTLRVGIVWEAGHFGVESLAWRNMPAAAFTPLSRIDGISLIALQKGHGENEYPAIPGAVSFASEISSFEDTAAIIADLDLVITVDSGVANLAGAMGAQVWVLLEPLHDGRYGLTHTPAFYPTMLAFRQRERGRWTMVMAEVADALRALIARQRLPSRIQDLRD